VADLPAPSPAEPVTDAPEKQRKLLLLLPILALVLGGGAGCYQYYRLSAAGQAAPEEEPIEYGQFTQLPGIIVNPAGSGGRRYLMIDLGLESAEAKTLEEVSAREVVIRDAVVRILSEKTVEQLASIDGRAALKDTLRLTVNRILKGDIDRLYFTQYVLQ